MEGNLRLKIDWASLTVEGKFTVLLCFTLYLTEIFHIQALGGLIFGGAGFSRIELQYSLNNF